ncbi:hypothetical protein M422DRAFT_276469 [Sphaerobolus stellatus SS14]|uniref:Uncharacterized protein n=1 Tax=Sphaerobolus stellatus (strain SS14) TaxID=990650 RepID=A0A0C9UC65_SPHS4|nr:hypothetical protein M422DRAFT_276469 [Sphaerobolus stellatus SS14]
MSRSTHGMRNLDHPVLTVYNGVLIIPDEILVIWTQYIGLGSMLYLLAKIAMIIELSLSLVFVLNTGYISFKVAMPSPFASKWPESSVTPV